MANTYTMEHPDYGKTIHKKLDQENYSTDQVEFKLIQYPKVYGDFGLFNVTLINGSNRLNFETELSVNSIETDGWVNTAFDFMKRVQSEASEYICCKDDWANHCRINGYYDKADQDQLLEQAKKTHDLFWNFYN